MKAIKICGLRRPQDAALAVALGATHLGCVLAADSPRGATLDEARAVRDAADGRRLVLVFRDPSAADVLRAADALDTPHVQLHCASDALVATLAERGLRCARAYSVGRDADRLPPFTPKPTADRPAVLDVGRGGTGQRFDWGLLGHGCPDATFVAGGITPHNVTALLPHAPWGIDLSSGIESHPGHKDHTAMRALFAALPELDS